MGTPNFRPIGLILAILCPKTQKNYLNGHVSRRDLAQIAIIQSLTSTTLVCVHNPPVKIPLSKSPSQNPPSQNPQVKIPPDLVSSWSPILMLS